MPKMKTKSSAKKAVQTDRYWKNKKKTRFQKSYPD